MGGCQINFTVSLEISNFYKCLYLSSHFVSFPGWLWFHVKLKAGDSLGSECERGGEERFTTVNQLWANSPTVWEHMFSTHNCKEAIASWVMKSPIKMQVLGWTVCSPPPPHPRKYVVHFQEQNATLETSELLETEVIKSGTEFQFSQ